MFWKKYSAKLPKCPRCGSPDILRSQQAGFWDTFQVLFDRWPFRCRSCRTRFYRAEAPAE